MKKIGITGGIGVGKTYVYILSKLDDYWVFKFLEE